LIQVYDFNAVLKLNPTNKMMLEYQRVLPLRLEQLEQESEESDSEESGSDEGDSIEDSSEDDS
jgi:hypothetical protein